MNKDDIANYSVTGTLRSGRQVTIRAIRRDDTGLIADALRRVSPESLYNRTFSARRIFNDKELAWLVNIDFERIVSIVAIRQDEGQVLMVGEGRYVRTEGGASTSAEVAFLVDDQHKRQGIGSLIFRHLADIARSAGITRFEAEVLPSNEGMLQLFDRSGLSVSKKTTGGTVHVTLELKDVS